jgi:hypothetical protein
MRKRLLILYGAAFALPLFPLASYPQASPGEGPLQSDLGVPTLRVTTREVLVDLIALDSRNHAVLDLQPTELQVSASAQPPTVTKHKKRWKALSAPASIAPITSLSIFDPNNSATATKEERTGFRILASCMERSTVHYLLAFHPGPDGWTSGFHRIAITSHRRSIKLFYRHQYYVGLAAAAPGQPTLKKEKVDQILQQSACYYPVDPLSIVIRAHPIDTGRTDVSRYLVSIDASSLSFLTLNTSPAGRELAGFDRRVELDYGICNFNQAGKPVGYFHSPLEQVLNSADYARALDRGFPHILEFPASGDIALTRVVLRDRATGNLAAVDVALPHADHPAALEASTPDERTDGDLKTYQDRLDIRWGVGAPRQPSAWLPPKPGPVGSFGSIVAAPHTFCGDVYELPDASRKLPDFRALDPIGAIYTSSLDVPNQSFSNTSGIPGVTPRTNLFGIDYHATFWVRDPGTYAFLLASDDGAILQIDDDTVIDLDGLHSVNAAGAHVRLDEGFHTIHVPYYQGAVDSVALELWIRPPGKTEWTLFNLNDYQPPATDATKSLGVSDH